MNSNKELISYINKKEESLNRFEQIFSKAKENMYLSSIQRTNELINDCRSLIRDGIPKDQDMQDIDRFKKKISYSFNKLSNYFKSKKDDKKIAHRTIRGILSIIIPIFIVLVLLYLLFSNIV